MAYAKASLIQDIRHLLQDNPWETTSTTTTTSVTVAVPDGTKWAAGDIGEWQTGTVGGEQFLVQSVSGNNLTVARGYNGTTAETHTSGDRVVKNPSYAIIQITDAIDRVIEGAYPTIWKAVSATVTPSSTTTWYDSGLTSTNLTGLIDLIGATQLYGASSSQVGFFGYGHPSRIIRMQMNMPTSLVSSGVGLRFPAGFWHTSNTVTVRYRTKLTSTVAASDYSDVDEGLLSEAITMGVCGRLVAAQEIRNVGEGARVDQSQVGSYTSVGSWFEQKSRELFEQYKMELERRIPRAKDQGYI